MAYQTTIRAQPQWTLCLSLNLLCMFPKGRGHVLAVSLTESLLLRFLLSSLSQSTQISAYICSNATSSERFFLITQFQVQFRLLSIPNCRMFLRSICHSDIVMYDIIFLCLFFLLNISSKRTGALSASWCLVYSGV